MLPVETHDLSIRDFAQIHQRAKKCQNSIKIHKGNIVQYALELSIVLTHQCLADAIPAMMCIIWLRGPDLN